MLDCFGLALRSSSWLLAPLLLLVAGCQPETDTRATPTLGAPTASSLEASATATERPDSSPTVTAASSTATRPASPSPGAQDDLASAGAANADVLFVEASQAGDGSWTLDVTVSHPDTGWDDYADGWDVVTPDGLVLKRDPSDPFTRLLLHPHVDEQPFTRSQSGIQIPAGVTQVTVRAHDLVAGFGGREVIVDLTADSGDNFKVE